MFGSKVWSVDLNESRSCKLTTASGSAFHWTELWPVEKMSTCIVLTGLDLAEGH